MCARMWPARLPALCRCASAAERGSRFSRPWPWASRLSRPLLARKGCPVRVGKELLIADDPAAFSRVVVQVLTDDGLRQRVGRNAREAVCARFGWEAATVAFARICKLVAQGRDVEKDVNEQLPALWRRGLA